MGARAAVHVHARATLGSYTNVASSLFNAVWVGLHVLFSCSHPPVSLALPISSIVNRTLPVPRKTAVLITGCSTGIGEDAALRLSRAGFLVFATVRKEADADKLKKKGNNMLFPVICDVTKEDQIKAAVDTVKKRLAQEDRKLLGVINNAGFAEFSAAELATPDVFRHQFETNVIGSVAISQAFLPLLRDFSSTSPSHGARLVFVSSVVGRFAPPGSAPYSSSKYAVDAIADSMRM